MNKDRESPAPKSSTSFVENNSKPPLFESEP